MMNLRWPWDTSIMLPEGAFERGTHPRSPHLPSEKGPSRSRRPRHRRATGSSPVAPRAWRNHAALATCITRCAQRPRRVKRARVRVGRVELPRAFAPSIARAWRLPIPPHPYRPPASWRNRRTTTRPGNAGCPWPHPRCRGTPGDPVPERRVADQVAAYPGGSRRGAGGPGESLRAREGGWVPAARVTIFPRGCGARELLARKGDPPALALPSGQPTAHPRH